MILLVILSVLRFQSFSFDNNVTINSSSYSGPITMEVVSYSPLMYSIANFRLLIWRDVNNEATTVGDILCDLTEIQAFTTTDVSCTLTLTDTDYKSAWQIGDQVDIGKEFVCGDDDCPQIVLFNLLIGKLPGPMELGDVYGRNIYGEHITLN